jgi:hypothetical protein
MSPKFYALKSLLEQTPRSLPALRKLESWGTGVDLSDQKLLELAVLLPQADVTGTLRKLKNATQSADGYTAPALSIQETIDRDPLGAVEALRQMRIEREPETPDPIQAIIDENPWNAPEILRSMAGKQPLTDRDLQIRRAEPKPRENYKVRNLG